MDSIEVRVLGRLGVRVNGTVLRPRGGRARATLLYLAAYVDQPVDRNELIALLWRPNELRDPNHSLSQVLYDLARQLPSDMLYRSARYVRIKESVRVDLDGLRRANADGKHALVLKYHYGQFGADVDVPESPAFDHWKAGLARTVERYVLDSIAILSRISRREGDHDSISKLSKRALTIDPYNERYVYERVQSLALCGMYNHAIDELEAGIRRMREDVGRPIPECLSELKARIISVQYEEDNRDLENDPRPPFVGRDNEVRMLRESFDKARRHKRGYSAVLLGEAGIGKSRLVVQFLRYAAIKGARIFVGRCREGQEGIPLLGLAEALLSGVKEADIERLIPGWRRELERLLPELSAISSRPAVSRDRADGSQIGNPRIVFEAVCHLLDCVAIRGLVVLVLEDIQWADNATRDFVKYFVTRVQETQVIMITTCRTKGPSASVHTECDPIVAELGVRIDIGELDPDEITALVHWYREKRGLPVSDEYVDWMRNTVGGRPLYCLELLNKHATFENARSTNTIGRVVQSMPAELQRILTARFADLSWSAERACAALAVLGGDAEAELLRPVAGLGRMASVVALEELSREGVAVVVRGRVTFTHDLLRETAISRLTSERKRFFHQRAANVLLNGGECRPGIALAHVLAAGEIARVWRLAIQAAGAAVNVHGFDEAERFLTIAKEHSQGDLQLAIATKKLIGLLCQLNRYPEAAGLLPIFDNAKAKEPKDIDTWFIQTKAGLMTGDIAAEEVLNSYADRLGNADLKLNGSTAVEALMMVAEAAFDVERMDVLARVRIELQRLAHDLDSDHRIVAEITANVARIDGITSSSSQFTQSAMKAVNYAQRSGNTTIRVKSLIAAGTSYLLAGRLLEARPYFSDAMEVTAEPQYRHLRARVVNNYAVLLMELGGLEEARDVLVHAARTATLHDLLFFKGNLALIEYHRGNNQSAIVLCHEIRLLNRRLAASWAEDAAGIVEGLALMEARRIETGSAAWQPRHDKWKRVGSLAPCYGRILVARRSVRRGDRRHALHILKEGLDELKDRDELGAARLRVAIGHLLAIRSSSLALVIATETEECAKRAGAGLIAQEATRLKQKIVGRYE